MNRIEELKQRHDKRKRHRRLTKYDGRQEMTGFPRDDDRSSHDEEDRDNLVKVTFFVRLFTAICLVLVVSIIFKHPSNNFQDMRTFVNQSFTTDFQFASLNGWYEEAFGEPLALLPSTPDQSNGQAQLEEAVPASYAVPANGQVMESFSKNGQGIILKTGSGTTVEAIKSGFVRSVEVREDTGKTVIVQHENGHESWYGELDEVSVKLYDTVQQGQKLGRVTDSNDGQSGKFYFAIKQGENFIDPIQVMTFD